MKDKQKAFEIAMEYQTKRDQEINRYVQIKTCRPQEDATDLGLSVKRSHILFDFWSSLSGVLNKGGAK